MVFHTFLFVVAVLLSYVRNGFGIIPVMLDCCAVFKIRFAIVFCPNRLKAVSVAVRNSLSRLSGVRPFFVSDTGRSGYAMPPSFAPLSPAFPEMPEYEGRD